MRNTLVQGKIAFNGANLAVSYLTEGDIKRLVDSCKRERGGLLILVLFQTGLRISRLLDVYCDAVWSLLEIICP